MPKVDYTREVDNMTTVERIDQIYEKMQTFPLSIILPLVLPIALESRDYEGYCILSCWLNPITKEKNANLVLWSGIERILLQEGIDKDSANRIKSKSFDEYMKMRTVDKDSVLCSSVKEIEDMFKSFDDMIAAVELPQGLHPVDLYYRSQTASKEKFVVIEKRQIFEKQYALLQSYLSTKLTEYRQKALLEERKIKLNESIKNTKDVFIIHGHNEAKLLELEKLLKNEFGLNPIILKDKPNQGLTIISKFEKYASQCSYAFALFTPDDIVTASNGKQYFQARPNVIFELGWFYASLGRAKVCILEQASDKSEIFSDLQGVMRIQFNNDIAEAVLSIRRELESVGII